MMRRMMLPLLLLLAASAKAQTAERDRWAAEAKAVTITRDDWGIAHVHGKTDADAVFGMIYAQCEDDFNRVETNYLVSLGRLAEAEGEERIWQDLRQRLFIDPDTLKADYARSPEWLKKLMDAWADGINFYLAQHPQVKPRAIAHFERWMALSFTEGSIGGDIEKVNLTALRAFYDLKDKKEVALAKPLQAGQLQLARGEVSNRETLSLFQQLQGADGSESGSNGFAISPTNTKNHHALLLINPHTSFFFRSELQMSSDEGLNAYGAVTWGQFFIYQGFNDRAGWMHTSSNVDAVDEYRETVLTPASGSHAGTYKYADGSKPFMTKQITLRYKTSSGMQERTFTAYFTHHGPVTRKDGEQLVTVKLMNVPVEALQQSYLRTKARSYAEYKKTMELKANSSNNTIFADADGDIAYWHGNFIPKRDTQFDYTKPLDGSVAATEWSSLMTLDEVPHLFNPKSGYIENVNNWPWSGSGESSLKRADFPAYVEQGGETARGLHAVRVLQGRRDFTLESLMTSAYDSYMPWFEKTIPALLKAYDGLPASAPEKTKLAEQIAALRAWDFRWEVDSVPTSLAVYWAETVGTPLTQQARRAGVLWEQYVVEHVDASAMLKGLQTASDKLTADFGTWKTPWGKINRFQRITDDIAPAFTDAGPSNPVGFVPSQWGSLASFQAHTYPGTKMRYGNSGNSFVAVVEFGDKVRARAITCGGESGDPGSKHFNDEAMRYAAGNLRDVYFYPDQLKAHIEKVYHPGE